MCDKNSRFEFIDIDDEIRTYRVIFNASTDQLEALRNFIKDEFDSDSHVEVKLDL
jgi:hypothetical protein